MEVARHDAGVASDKFLEKWTYIEVRRSMRYCKISASETDLQVYMHAPARYGCMTACMTEYGIWKCMAEGIQVIASYTCMIQ